MVFLYTSTAVEGMGCLPPTFANDALKGREEYMYCKLCCSYYAFYSAKFVTEDKMAGKHLWHFSRATFSLLKKYFHF